MKGKRVIADYRFGHLSSIIFLAMVFILIAAVAILGTLYTAGILNSGNTQQNAFSITNALCNGSGVFLSLKNNLNEPIYISSAKLLVINKTLSLAAGTAFSYALPAEKQIELSSGGYSCPAFNSLPQLDLQIVFNSSSTTVYTFGNNYWTRTLTNPYTNISETTH